jgi:hypothetical protein
MQATLPADAHFHDKLSSDWDNLKGQCHEIFCFRFFYESSSPQANLPPVSTTLTANFATGTTGFIDTGGK